DTPMESPTFFVAARFSPYQWRDATPVCFLPITNHQSPITDHRSQITDYRLLITDYRLLITDLSSAMPRCHRLSCFSFSRRHPLGRYLFVTVQPADRRVERLDGINNPQKWSEEPLPPSCVSS